MIGKTFKSISFGSSIVEIKRTEGGVAHIKADNFFDVQKGLGFAHAHDRLMQMYLTCLLAEGRITEFIFDSEEAFAFDFLMRKIGLNQDIASDMENLSDDTKKWCLAYCEGVNTYIERFGFPLLYKTFRLPFKLWKIADTMLLIKMHMYLGLAQAQERIERFILQAIHDGVDVDKLKKLFTPHLDKLDKDSIHLIQNLRLERPYLDIQMQFVPGLSNNWAVSGQKSFSGKPLCAFDPHLQVNRLPGIWYEAILQAGDDFQMGITTPGFPGQVMGRCQNLSASFTYGMMDTVDFFIEEVEGNHCKREEGWRPLIMREEVFKRKKRGSVVLKFFETDVGVIERKDYRKDSFEKGLYLSLGWSCAKKGVSPILNALVKLWNSDTVFEAGKIVREITLPGNWVLADNFGNIAYQQSGKLPKRNKSVLFPLPAWKRENLWQGFVDSEDLSADYNPASGFVASANDDKNQTGKPLSVMVPYAQYRQERISHYLSQDKKFTIEEMQQLQCDLYSIQAEKFLIQIRELCPDTFAGNCLRNWDCCYTKDSLGATLFEAFYLELLIEVFGKVFGQEAWNRIVKKHSLLVFTHGHFDRILLSDDSSWFEPIGKKECFKHVLEKVLNKFQEGKIPPWGEKNRFMMYNLFFDGRLPKFLGFDSGPLEIEGSRATIAASFVFHERKRTIAVAASCRFVTDLAAQEAYTILAGGASESRFSPYYTADVEKWLNFLYKKLKLN